MFAKLKKKYAKFQMQLSKSDDVSSNNGPLPEIMPIDEDLPSAKQSTVKKGSENRSGLGLFKPVNLARIGKPNMEDGKSVTLLGSALSSYRPNAEKQIVLRKEGSYQSV